MVLSRGKAPRRVLVKGLYTSEKSQLICRGLGFGVEPATVDSDLPLRADGLVSAFRMALAEASCDMAALDFRITDNSGEQYGFKEAALGLTRVLKKRKAEFDIWHPADCIGEVGAAIAMVILGVGLIATQKKYTPGYEIMCHLSNDNGNRAAFIISYHATRDA